MALTMERAQDIFDRTTRLRTDVWPMADEHDEIEDAIADQLNVVLLMIRSL